MHLKSRKEPALSSVPPGGNCLTTRDSTQWGFQSQGSICDPAPLTRKAKATFRPRVTSAPAPRHRPAEPAPTAPYQPREHAGTVALPRRRSGHSCRSARPRTCGSSRLTKELLRPGAIQTLAILSLRHNSAMLSSPRRPDRTIRIFSSDECTLHVARRMSFTTCYWGAFVTGFFITFTTIGGREEP